MAAESISILSRLPNFEKPRPSVPSRTSSLKYSHAGSAHEASNFTKRPSSANARDSGETPASSWGVVNFPPRPTPASNHRRSVSIDATSQPTLASIQRSHSLRGAPLSTNVTKRSASVSAVTMRNTTRTARPKRWAGLTRTVSDWDGLRRDPELWFEDGDCYVHLYARGQSRRGPSFRVPMKALRQSKCGAMFSLCFAQTTSSPGSQSKSSRRVSNSFSALDSESQTVELYIPAPEDASKEDSFNWHVTSRNFFAWVFDKPLVGSHLGRALVDLHERMQLFRSGQINNKFDLLDYADSQGYRDFADCADYSLAMLYYAEHYKLRDLWIDAFVHCVGMFETLSFSQEFDPISRLTKALITRASLEMDIHLGRVTMAVSSFIEDDTSPAYLGLSDGGRAHLDRFRSFLHTFYVEKFGYWPPPKGVAFSKALYKSMYFDFMNLYDYLVDLDSTSDLSTQKPASGGICVLQNVDSFDKRHDFIPLPHPLPLLPMYEALSKKTSSQKSLRTLTLSTKQSKTDRYVTTRAALTAATNSRDISVTTCPIVQAYMRFEQQCALNQREEKVSMADARKIRWILIYGTLQWLISAIRAPREVRDTEGAEYPLCCLVTEQSPWQVGAKASISQGASPVNVPEAINNYLSNSNCEVPTQLTPGAPEVTTIHPDCEVEGYFTHTNTDVTPLTSRPVSVEVPQPLRISSANGPVMLSRSLRRLSFSARSSRRNSVTLPSSNPPKEVAMQTHASPLDEPSSAPASQPISRSESFINRSSRSSKGPETSWLRLDYTTPEFTPRHSRRPSKLELCTDDTKFEQVRTPCLDSFTMDQLVTPTTVHGNESSNHSDTTDPADPFWSDQSSTSSKSSTHGETLERKSSSAEISGLLGGLVPLQGTVSSPVQSPSPKTTLQMSRNSREGFRFDFGSIHPNGTELAQSERPPSSTFEFGFHALSGPPSPSPQMHAPPPASLSFDSLPTYQPPQHVARRNSSKKAIPPMSPLRMHPTNPKTVPSKTASSEPSPVVGIAAAAVEKKDGGIMDIFSALSLAPNEDRKPKEKEPVGRSATEKGRSASAASPPPVKTAPLIDMKAVVAEAEKSRKRERRKSFWRR